ncbi:MAG: alkaline phosphatase family protein [Candidatus Nanoarchaeia archaeon]
MLRPDYSNCILNLVSSVLKGTDNKADLSGLLKPLKQLPTINFDKKNTLVLIIDGLGYEFLKNHGKKSFMYKNLHSRITSVFPSTTASAITSFFTGLTPAEHASTGWFVWLKEFGCVTSILPFETRCGGLPFSATGIMPQDVIKGSSIFNRVNVNSAIINKHDIINSEASEIFFGMHSRYPYETLNGLFLQAKKALKRPDKNLVFAYWPHFDKLAHEKGINHKDVIKHFKELDAKLSKFTKNLKNTKVIVTSDHGLIDSTKNKNIRLQNHPKLEKILRLPLCGEPRTAYCYVKAGMNKEFENYVKKLEWCDCYPSDELVKKNFFGPGKNPQLKERIGDYCLLMKDNYVLLDLVYGEYREKLVGFHGGVSKEEMYVPLIDIET